MVDLDRIADWAPSFAVAQKDNVPESVRAQMVEASPELFEDALVKLLRIPINSDTCSNPYRTPIPMDIGQVSERSDALGLVIKRCPI